MKVDSTATRTALCLLFVLPAVVVALVRLTGLERGPFVQLLAFTPYIAAWSLIPLLLMLALRRWKLAAFALLAVVILGGAVLPRSFGTLAQGPGALRVLTVNMQFGAADPAALVTFVRDNAVDVLALQEYTPEAETALRAAGLDIELPFAQTNPLPKASGSAVYSRHALADGGVRMNPGQFAQSYATLTSDQGFRVIIESVHTTPPAHLDNLAYWRRDLNSQPRSTTDNPRIMLGDFNSTLDHAPFRDLLTRGYRDAAATAGSGFTATWGPYEGRHGDRKPIPPITIDHVLADKRIDIGEVSAHALPRTDHRALLVDLYLPKQ
ncbi:endonuclease/exonuclease/phosphatase family protein [Nocardia sp. 2]|uniref:Endonuclease/exonuclease/phosphatase family protein n=1 Tax=Nocardia acididurans TaxID=2802282 RepID=A0ABS1M7X8_9NOCA|nr:endonuclease/exonuclease/phosphatase family protein [Nocardia acididurans]MBL1076140.1 endonuclease/exonuclease/phosphatase family protein [Nocardia acididurans]